jgi:hypothetical protein
MTFLGAITSLFRVLLDLQAKNVIAIQAKKIVLPNFM